LEFSISETLQTSLTSIVYISRPQHRDIISSSADTNIAEDHVTGAYPRFFLCRKRWISLKLGRSVSCRRQHSHIRS